MSTYGIQKITQKFGGLIAKNSPTILTGFAVAGLITTAVLAVKATPKAIELMKDKQVELDADFLTSKEIVECTWKCYVPAAIMGLVTVGCIIGANSISLRRNAALASVYSLSEAALKEYQAKVVETLGKNKEKAVRDDIHKDRIAANPVSNCEIALTGRGETLCYDPLGGGYFKSDIEFMRQTLNRLSRDLMSDMYISLNHVYNELGLRGTKLGDMVGWHIDDGLIEPDFSSQITDNGTPCLVLDYVTDPRVNHNGY
jgi:hypothetical protein